MLIPRRNNHFLDVRELMADTKHIPVDVQNLLAFDGK